MLILASSTIRIPTLNGSVGAVLTRVILHGIDRMHHSELMRKVGNMAVHSRRRH